MDEREFAKVCKVLKSNYDAAPKERRCRPGAGPDVSGAVTATVLVTDPYMPGRRVDDGWSYFIYDGLYYYGRTAQGAYYLLDPEARTVTLWERLPPEVGYL